MHTPSTEARCYKSLILEGIIMVIRVQTFPNELTMEICYKGLVIAIGKHQ